MVNMEDYREKLHANRYMPCRGDAMAQLPATYEREDGEQIRNQMLLCITVEDG